MTLESDVCVCGAGPSGFMAAMAAARAGARTVLVEKYGFAGGLATAGLVGPISKFNFGGRRVVGGIPLEFVNRMASRGGAIIDLPSGNIPFDSEAYKSTALEMLLEAGVRLVFDATVYATEFDERGSLTGVQATANGTSFGVQASHFVDCTGTGTLIAGNPDLWRQRNRSEHTQPLSLIFKLAGVDTDSITVLMRDDGVRYANAKLRKNLTAAVEDELISNFGGPWAVWGSALKKGMVSVNCTRYGGDATDPLDLSQAEISMRQDMLAIIEIIKHADPAFEHAFLVESAVTAGYRESREINGAYRVAADDIFERKMPAKTIAFGAHPVDRHLAGSSEQKVQFLEAPYAIPYDCMISTHSPNLLAAGALAAAEPVAYATMRVQAQCMAMGQAAGTAAALCAEQQCDVNNLSTARLRGTLRQHQAIVDL
jgi:hypothetical protein